MRSNWKENFCVRSSGEAGKQRIKDEEHGMRVLFSALCFCLFREGFEDLPPQPWSCWLHNVSIQVVADGEVIVTSSADDKYPGESSSGHLNSDVNHL